MGQTWDDLLFAHWRLPAEMLRSHLPPGLRLDTFDGSAWLGITPFVLNALRLRGLPPLPGVSSFPELNVRTYVTAEAKPGIWFFSLDAASILAVRAARLTYRLPYVLARMSAVHRGGTVEYASVRRGEPSVFRARYRPTGTAFEASSGSLEHFLTERYCLYAADRGTLYRAEIHHPPWSLRTAEAEIELNTMPPDGIELPADAPLLHLASRQDVVIWPLNEVAGAAARSSRR